MCGRYVAPGVADIERAFHLGRSAPSPFAPTYNTLPTDRVPVLRRGADGLELVPMRWGLIPAWWKDAKLPRSTINARAEEAANKPVWREAWRQGRCLVPAVGWYEWATLEAVDPQSGEVRSAKQPYYIYPAEGGVVAFAGLMTTWRPVGGEPVATCAIVTHAAAGPIAAFHDRMPVVLSEAGQAAWLDPALRDPVKIANVIESESRRDFAFHPVSPRVGSRLNQGPDLIARIA